MKKLIQFLLAIVSTASSIGFTTSCAFNDPTTDTNEDKDAGAYLEMVNSVFDHYTKDTLYLLDNDESGIKAFIGDVRRENFLQDNENITVDKIEQDTFTLRFEKLKVVKKYNYKMKEDIEIYLNEDSKNPFKDIDNNSYTDFVALLENKVLKKPNNGKYIIKSREILTQTYNELEKIEFSVPQTSEYTKMYTYYVPYYGRVVFNANYKNRLSYIISEATLNKDLPSDLSGKEIKDYFSSTSQFKEKYATNETYKNGFFMLVMIKKEYLLLKRLTGRFITKTMKTAKDLI
ncbi:hypothetical protein SLITO_v1c10960 [Spiroplasma litorale]|uniref:Lipoprotein n=1 Tax=Spiroplasma litorale TaxID=216942 RepID=A0A0K1W3L5_9MOLU|nr:hypothetical protein [Spiroplasma litorale]AKX34707.1 hypothetical protein SLITO_v1c10960 [Spiroplasma litorale]